MNKANTNRKIGVIGLGYVGLAIASLFSQNGYEVIGIDIDESKIKNIQAHKNNLPGMNLKASNLAHLFHVYSNYEHIRDVHVIIICIPTPLSDSGVPDLSYLKAAAESLVPHLNKGQLIVLESSSYPGTTREFLKPILEKSEFQIGKDLFLAYSPERIDPGNREFTIENIPKVVSGITDKCLREAADLYSSVFNRVITAETTEIAEMSKLLENSYRYINISFINEISRLCDLLNINVWEVIEAASTKPFGFEPFYPGPGAGGHCIPIDPLYLKWKVNQIGGNSEFIEAANRENKIISEHIVQKIIQIVSFGKNQLKKKKILICGVTYKKDINDIRESPALPIMETLLNKGVDVSYHDPFVHHLTIGDLKLSSVDITEETLKEYDCVAILTDHSSLPLHKIIQNSKYVYDTKNILKGKNGKAKVFVLGDGQL